MFLQVLTFLRTDRFIKNGVTNIPVVSILPSQLNEMLKEKNVDSHVYELLLGRLPEIYKTGSKRGIQTFLSPSSDLTIIPQRNSTSAVYARCIQIYKSAISQSTLELLEMGKLISFIHNDVIT